MESLDIEVFVIRQDKYEQSLLRDVDKIVFSPGPGLPSEGVGMMKCLADAQGKLPILGVCLGMQAITLHNGGRIYNLQEVKHGVSERIEVVPNSSLFKDIPTEIEVGLYHSWACDVSESLNLKEIAKSKTKVTMAIEDLALGLYGVQFHPESILTKEGKQIMQNFLFI